MPNRVPAILCTSLLALFILYGCQPPVGISTPVEITFEPDLTETPVPDCVSLPDVKLKVILLSENSVQVRITGLQPNEPVYTIFSSQAEDGKRKSTECCPGETASAEGIYEYSIGLRGPEIDREFTDWRVQVIHSRGAACSAFILP